MDKTEVPAQLDADPKFAEEWRKMQNGEIYEAMYPPFGVLLRQTRCKTAEYNAVSPDDTARLDTLIRRILGSCGANVNIVPPFQCDFGFNIHVGENFMANYNFCVLDEAPVTIGDNVFIGPNTGIYTACHPLDPALRNKGVEWAEPVTIGRDVWIGGGTTILPGVTIGEGTTIGAGSVVTKDIPARCVAAGNPCRVLRTL